MRSECLDRLILCGERRLLRALDEFVAHYHGERNHQVGQSCHSDILMTWKRQAW